MKFDYLQFDIDRNVAKSHYEQLVEHIRYVQEFGVKLNVPQKQLEVHDQSKFSAQEFPFYARYFHGGKKEVDKEPFSYGWLHHVHNNPHHWDYWLLQPNYNFGVVEEGVFEMPEKYVREMIADWQSASKVYTGSEDMSEWLNNNLGKIRLHNNTRLLVSSILENELGYK